MLLFKHFHNFSFSYDYQKHQLAKVAFLKFLKAIINVTKKYMIVQLKFQTNKKKINKYKKMILKCVNY